LLIFSGAIPPAGGRAGGDEKPSGGRGLVGNYEGRDLMEGW